MKNKNVRIITDEESNYIHELILPLLGISEDEIEYSFESLKIVCSLPVSSTNANYEFNGVAYFENNGYILIDLEMLNGELNRWIYIEFKNKLSKEFAKLFSYLIKSYYTYGKEVLKRIVNNALIRERLNDLVLQKGLFSYVLDDLYFKNDWIDNLYKCLQRWSEKTYEGHNVCFGFLINPSIKAGTIKSESFDHFLEFVGEEYSAVFTDGITSIVEIDKECNYLGYHSILCQGESMPDNYEDVRLPIRFAQVIYKYVKGDKTGIFLLTNGDIIIAQKQRIAFVRRNGRWLNFSDKSFYNIINSYAKMGGNSNKLLNGIYCSCLDISFAHSGGLIAVVDENDKKWQDDLKGKKPIISKIDLIQEDDFVLFPRTLEDYYENESKRITKSHNLSKSVKNGQLKDLKKKVTKKRFLLEILKNDRDFLNIDRKLRADLSGLDGAIILNRDGKIIACGAIIANSAGSSGGGRGSAARTLSKYGGFAIKISTDGYIEAFFKEARIYSIK